MVQAGLINQKTKRKLHELKLPTFQIAFAFIKQLDLAIECSCSLLLSRQLGRTSNISTLCPLIRNERSTSRRMWGGRRFSMNWATKFSHRFISNSLSVVIGRYLALDPAPDNPTQA